MDHDQIAAVAQACERTIATALDTYRPQLLDAGRSHDRHQVPNQRHRDNFLSHFDLELHRHYRDELRRSVGGFTYLSEEADPETIGEADDLVVLVDPLDTSELAVRGLHGYTHVLAWSRRLDAPVAAVVGDFFHEVCLYTAVRTADGARAALRTRAGDTHELRTSPPPVDGPLLVTNYSMRPTTRFAPLAAQHDLLAGLAQGLGPERSGPGDPSASSGQTGDRGRIGVDFGSIGLCHVASGATDAFVEFAKGFALWDLLPGRFILEAAGGTVTDLTGTPLAWPSLTDPTAVKDALTTRQTFVAAPTPATASALAGRIHL